MPYHPSNVGGGVGLVPMSRARETSVNSPDDDEDSGGTNLHLILVLSTGYLHIAVQT